MRYGKDRNFPGPRQPDVNRMVQPGAMPCNGLPSLKAGESGVQYCAKGRNRALDSRESWRLLQRDSSASGVQIQAANELIFKSWAAFVLSAASTKRQPNPVLIKIPRSPRGFSCPTRRGSLLSLLYKYMKLSPKFRRRVSKNRPDHRGAGGDQLCTKCRQAG